jgi:uncharacterized protein (DUF2147 family)
MFKRTKTAIVAAGLVLTVMAPQASAGSADPYGVWTMANGKVSVRVRDCGGNLCGAIVALKEPISKIDGKPKVDRKNPKTSLRSRPLIGLQVLIAMKPEGEGAWSGAIYNPDDGRTYSASIRYDGGSSMSVKGCVVGILCKTNTFVRIQTASN